MYVPGFVVSLLLGASPVIDAFLVTPDVLGLPPGNRRTAEPYEVRVYPADERGNAIRTGLDRYVKPYPIIVDQSPDKRYRLAEDETAVFHGGLDLSSRPQGSDRPAPLDFQAGVFGTVMRARGTDGVILVMLPNGNFVHYLHTSQAYVKPGQEVTPDTVLGKTGNVGTGPVHLHLQATDVKGNPIDVDQALLEGREKRTSSRRADVENSRWTTFQPDLAALPKPAIVDGVVHASQPAPVVYVVHLYKKWNPGDPSRNKFKTAKEAEDWASEYRRGVYSLEDGTILRIEIRRELDSP